MAHETRTVRPGALTALLEELAGAPASAGWEVPLAPGDSVGRFEVVHELGRGGFGVVYEALDRELGRPVAFKAIRRGASDATQETALLAEAEAAARLAHPNIVHLYDLGRAEQGPYLILELLRGRTLQERLVGGALPPREAVRVAVEVARGLAHAHRQGVVHRDLKPGNVFLCDDGQVKVLDFGLAHVFGRGGSSGGTPAYMPPEQARGEPGDERADVYSFGVVLAELWTGRRPFGDGGARGLASGERGPELPGAPLALQRLVARMLAREPSERPRSAEEVLAALLAVQRAMEPRRLLLAATALAALAVAAAGWIATHPPLPAGPLLAVLADADNATGDPDLDGLSELLRLGLDQTRRLQVMGRPRMVNELRQREGRAPAAIGAEEAERVAAWTGAPVVLLPAVRRVAAGYELELAIRGGGRELQARRRTVAGEREIPAALDELVASTGDAVGAEPRDALGPPVPIAAAAPPTPEGWRRLWTWERLRSEGRGDEAREALDALLSADPGNPLARILATQGREADMDLAYRHLDAALASLGRAPPRERALVEALAVPLTGRSQYELFERLDALIATWPEDPMAGLAAARVQLAIHGDAAAARPYLERALLVAPLAPGEEVELLLAAGRLDEALARARRRVEERREAPALRALAKAHRARGEVAEALQAAREALALGRVPPEAEVRWAFLDAGAVEELEGRLGGTGEARAPHWLALTGRWREALAALDAQAPGPGASPDARGWHHWLRADLLGHGPGDGARTWRETVAQFEETCWTLSIGGTALAHAGALDEARRLLEENLTTHEGRAGFRVYEAARRRAAGERDEALRTLEGISGQGSGYDRGVLLAELGRDREAVEAFRAYRRAVDTPASELAFHPFLTAAFYPRSLLGEAQALERLGERGEAVRVVRRLLRLWKQADAGYAPAREARALEARLVAGGRGG